MSDIEQTIERISKNVGCDTAALKGRMDAILEEQQEGWLSAGKNEEQCTLLALRVAGRQIKSEVDRAKKSGCVIYEGMYVSVPRYKDWAQLSYNKFTKQLETLPQDAREGLVENGTLVMFEYDPVSDGYIKTYNESLARKDTFVAGFTTTTVTELPKGTVEVNSNLHYYLVWNSTMPTFPSGGRNFKYGEPRPASEKDRTCLFFGRKQGSDIWDMHTFKFSGALAEDEPVSFVPGTIAMRPARQGSVAYAKPQVSIFSENTDLASNFPADPMGIVKEATPHFLEGGLNDLEGFIDNHREDKNWYDLWVAMNLEVVQIDPRGEGKGYIITVGDLDIESMASPVDIYIPDSHAHLIDFGVGSQMLVVGQGWMSRDDEAKLSVNGWYCTDALQPTATEGWD